VILIYFRKEDRVKGPSNQPGRFREEKRLVQISPKRPPEEKPQRYASEGNAFCRRLLTLPGNTRGGGLSWFKEE